MSQVSCKTIRDHIQTRSPKDERSTGSANLSQVSCKAIRDYIQTRSFEEERSSGVLIDCLLVDPHPQEGCPSAALVPIKAAASFSQVSFETMPDHIQTRSFEEERSTGGIDYLFVW